MAFCHRCYPGRCCCVVDSPQYAPNFQQFASQLEIQQRARQSQMFSVAPSNLFGCAYCLKMVREDETCECIIRKRTKEKKRKLLLTIKRKVT